MISRKNLNNICMVVCVFVLGLGGLTQATTYYVNPGDSIQAAIDASSDSDEIEVAPGTYPEAINFLGKAVRLYSRDGPEVTIIDGTGYYHVVQCILGEDANTILEGFTITGGISRIWQPGDPDDKSNVGAGMLDVNSSPKVVNCIFTGNVADHGGGMYNHSNSNPTVINCTFAGNTARVHGAGMANYQSSPEVRQCIFNSNDANGASSNGGGMYNQASSNPTLTNCTFIGNEAIYGGGMYNTESSPTVTDCTFSGNSASSSGGGMYNDDNSSPSVTNCKFSENEAYRGGGMYNITNSSPTVTNCMFSGNSAGWNGGGMYNITNSSPTVTNCTFTGNTASSGTYGGGGMFNHTGSNPIMTNCTFSGNTATTDGGGIYNYNASSPSVTNCILWGDTPDEIFNHGTSSSTVTYSDVQGGYSGTGNIDADPLFLDAPGGDFRFISSGSPCVDAGDNSVVTEPNDLAGNPRVVDGDGDASAVVDMGAYELQPRQIHNITQETWYETIQTAIDDANDGDQIEVGPGTYNEAINFGGKATRLYSRDGAEVTTIDGSGAYHVVQCVSGEGPDTILEGFTITGGNASGPLYADRDGAGMYNVSSSPTVTNCIFRDNTADNHGGGMLNIDCAPTLTGCTFQNNSASGALGGGGLYNHNSSPTVTECEFSGNTATTNGGGMFNISTSSPTVTNCTFSGNTANHGGGMANYTNSAPVVTNCTFINNGRLVIYDFENIAPNQGVDVPAPPSFVNDKAVIASDLGIVQGSGVALLNTPYRDGVIPGQKISFQQGIPAYTQVSPENYNFFQFSVAAVDSPHPITSISFWTGHNDIPDSFDHEGIIEYRTPGGALLGSDAFIIPYGITPARVRITPSIALFAGAEPTFFRIRFNQEIYGMNSWTVQLQIDDVELNSASQGGAIYNISSSPTVVNCSFSANTATVNGGAMYNDTSSPTVTDCTFSGNSAGNGSGMCNYTNSSPTVTNCTFTDNANCGMYNNGSSPTVTDCTFTGNSSSYGGGMGNHESSPTVTNCKFTANTATVNAGGMYNYNSHPTVTNCTFTGNTASSETHGGAGMWNHGSSPTVTNCTFTGNTATTAGGGMYNYTNSYPTVTNCILWGNTPDEIFNSGGIATVAYSDVKGSYSGTGNINDDPCFVDADANDLRLLYDSPCIDAADTTAVPTGIFIDVDGKPRVLDDLQTPNTGVSILGVTVDMGAYEFQPCYIPGDINCDGVVDFRDVALLCCNWLAGAEPE